MTGLTLATNIWYPDSRLHPVISNLGRGGVILLIHSWRYGVKHRNLVSMSSYLVETNICNIVAIAVVHAEVFKPKISLNSSWVGSGGFVNSRVPKTVRHGTPLYRICLKLLIDLSPRQLESQNYVYQPTVKLFGLSPIWLESQASVRRPTLKLFGSSPSRLESQASVRRPLLKIFGSSPSRLSFDQSRNWWLTSQPSVLWPSQHLTTHVLDVCPPNVTETKMSPIVCTAQN